MPHVGIKCFATGHTQHNGTERDECGELVLEQEVKAVIRIDGSQHTGVFGNLHDTQRCQNCEPRNHGWPEVSPDDRGAVALNRKQANQNADGNR